MSEENEDKKNEDPTQDYSYLDQYIDGFGNSYEEDEEE
jgi:hypothetical protein